MRQYSAFATALLSALLAGLAVTTLAGCGTKGALVLPPKPSVTQQTVQAAPVKVADDLNTTKGRAE